MCKWIIILLTVLALSIEAQDSIRFPIKGQTVNPANVQKLENKAVLDIAPTLKELGKGWNSNYIVFVIDPMGKPTEQVAANNPNPKGLLEELHRMMKKTGRTSYLRMHYLHETNPVPFQVHIQRWGDPEAMAPEAFPRDSGDGADLAIGERACWVNGFGWGLHFQRGQYFVAIELVVGEEKFEAEKARILQLARIIDAKIQEKPAGMKTNGATLPTQELHGHGVRP